MECTTLISFLLKKSWDAVGWQLLTAILTDVSWRSCMCPVLPEPRRQCLGHSRGSRAGPFLTWCDSLPMEGPRLQTPTSLAKTLAEQCCRWRLFPPQTPSFPFSFLRNQTYTTVSLHLLLFPSPRMLTGPLPQRISCMLKFNLGSCLSEDLHRNKHRLLHSHISQLCLCMCVGHVSSCNLRWFCRWFIYICDSQI